MEIADGAISTDREHRSVEGGKRFIASQNRKTVAEREQTAHGKAVIETSIGRIPQNLPLIVEPGDIGRRIIRSPPFDRPGYRKAAFLVQHHASIAGIQDR